MFPLLLPCEIEYIKTSFIRQYGKCNYRNSISRGAPKAKGPAFRAGPHCRGVRSPLDSNLKCSTKSVSKAQGAYVRSTYNCGPLFSGEAVPRSNPLAFTSTPSLSDSIVPKTIACVNRLGFRNAQAMFARRSGMRLSCRLKYSMGTPSTNAKGPHAGAQGPFGGVRLLRREDHRRGRFVAALARRLAGGRIAGRVRWQFVVFGHSLLSVRGFIQWPCGP